MQQISHKLKVRLPAAFPHSFRDIPAPRPLFSGQAGWEGGPAGFSRKYWGSWGPVWAGEPGRKGGAFSDYPPRGDLLGSKATKGSGSCEKWGDSDSPEENNSGHSGMPSLSSLGLEKATHRCTGGPCSPHAPSLPWASSALLRWPPLWPRPHSPLSRPHSLGLSRHPGDKPSQH